MNTVPFRILLSVVVAMSTACSSGRSAEDEASAATESASACRMMKMVAQIPPGFHPVTVDWRKNDPRGDMVCIARTEGKQIRFIPWLEFPMPAGYYVLYEYPNPSTRFNGCKRWSVFNGQYNCIDMYPSYAMRKVE